MLAALSRMRRFALARPSGRQVLVGASGACLAGCAHLFGIPLAAGLESVSLESAAVMVTSLIAGWPGSAASLLFLTVATLWSQTSLLAVIFTTLAAAVGAELLRFAARPIHVAALLLVAILLPHLEMAHGTLLITSTKTLAAAILSAGFNVALATLLFTLLPRRVTGLLGHRRVRLDDILFIAAFGTFTAGTLALLGTAAKAPDSLADARAACIFILGAILFAACFFAGRRIDALSRRLAQTLSARPSQQTNGETPRGTRYANLALELARVFFVGARETDRLRRQVATHGKRIDSIREHVTRLRRAFQERDLALRAREAELATTISTNADARARWQAFADAIPDVLLLADKNGRIEFANAAVQSMLGFNVEDLRGRSVSFLLPEPLRGNHPLDLDAMALPAGNSQEQEVKVRHAALGTREVAVRIQAFEIRGERGFGIRLRDVTGLKYILAELKRSRALVDAAQRSSGHFIAMMSHEIRTPLHGLMATLDMLRDEALSAEGRHRIGIARVSARSLLSLANDILDLTRIDAGAFPLEHKPFDLARVVHEVVDEARARAESLGLQLWIDISGPLPKSFIGDPGRIKQILGNLVSNALKFTITGGVSLQVRQEERGCVIDIIDTGEGVPEDKRDAIFDPFIQAESAGSRRAGGAGLGLPISRRLSETMGGSLALLKTGPSGSTFRVILPLQPSDEEPVEDQSQRILKNPPGRILVVEDHPANQYGAQTLLESLECTVTVASAGTEALELLEQKEFDLVLMDCQMPGMDGYETTRRMRSTLKRYVPVIAMTANARGDDRQRCLDAGMDDFLPKPFSKSALSDMLCKWLVPGANAIADGDIADRLSTLPALDGVVFDELWQSLQWRMSPLRKIYESFLSVAQETVELLENATLEDSQMTSEAKMLARKLHTLLGSGGMVGARQVERLAAWLEDAVKADRRPELAAGRALLADTVRRFEAELDRRLDAVSGRDR